MLDARCGHLGRSGEQVVRKGRGQRLTGRIERHLFVECGSDALSKSTENLAVHDHRIDQLAPIFDDNVVENFNIADFRIDGDQRGVGGITECAAVGRRTVADCCFQPAHIDACGQILRL